MEVDSSFSTLMGLGVGMKRRTFSISMEVYYRPDYNIAVRGMKKFMALKKSIVESKNEPTLLETYLNSIRSSCYKITSPQSSPRNLTTPAAVTGSGSKGPAKQASGQKTIYRCNISDMLEECRQKQGQYGAGSITPHKLDEIFSTLSSECRSGSEEHSRRKCQRSEAELIASILGNLQRLAQKQQYAQSVRLIISIMREMSTTNHRNSNNQHHSDREHQKIAQKLYQQLGISPNNSHYTSCVQHPDEHSSLTPPREHLYECQSQAQPLIVKYSVQPFPQPTPASEQGQQESLDDTMQSHDLNAWQDQLYCISEHSESEEEGKSSRAGEKVIERAEKGKIPQETIEFKKILYMIESESTSKKQKPPPRAKASTASQLDSSTGESRKLFTDAISEISCHSHEWHQSEDKENYCDAKPSINKGRKKSSGYPSSNSNSSKNTRKEVPLYHASTSEFNSRERSRREIISMLHNKHCRNTTL